MAPVWIEAVFPDYLYYPCTMQPLGRLHVCASYHYPGCDYMTGSALARVLQARSNA